MPLDLMVTGVEDRNQIISLRPLSGRITTFLLAGFGFSQISLPSDGLRPLRFGFASTSLRWILHSPGMVNCPEPVRPISRAISSVSASKNAAMSFFDNSVDSAMLEMI